MQIGTGESERIVGLLEQHLIFRSEIEELAVVIYRFDAFPKFFIQNKRGRVVAEFTRSLHSHLHHGVTAVCRQQGVESTEHTVEILAHAFERHDSVLEIRTGALLGDSVNLLTGKLDTAVDSRHPKAVVYLAERYCAVGCALKGLKK